MTFLRGYFSPPILQTIRNLGAQELNAHLATLDRTDSLHGFLQAASPGFWCWSPGRRLIHLLTVERLGDLTVPVRAGLVRAMQKGITGSAREQGIINIIEGTRGPDLTRLKNRIDSHSPQDMAELVYHDVDAKRRQRRIFRHIETEGKAVKPGIPLLVSDIDDTVFCNWKDERYPKKTVYPGMHAFYRALGRFERNDWERRGPVFASARPEEGAGIVESYTVGNLREIGFERPTVLSGDLFHILGASIADGKYKNFVNYERLFPEFTKILLGDNGQYDVEFIRRVLEAYAEIAVAGFIHDVTDSGVERLSGYSSEVVEAPVATRRMYYFDTYLGAALAALGETFISLEDLHQVAREAFAEFDRIPFETPLQKVHIWNFLKRDLDAAQRKYGRIVL